MKKGLSFGLAIVTILTMLCVPAFASPGVDEATLQKEGTALLTALLDRQFNAFMTAESIDTSDIFANTPGTELYKQYLYWYTGKSAATGEYWTDYDYTLTFDSIDDDTITFTADLIYRRTCSLYHSEAYGFEYIIRLVEEDGCFYISDIDSGEVNFFGFKNRLYGGFEDGIAVASEDISTVSVNKLDAMIEDYVELTELMDSADIDLNDVVDMDAEYAAYLKSEETDNMAELAATSYTYNSERGRTYADLYYKDGNGCFYNADGKGGDCTNWVSQCVWAAYGGWTSGDSVATMEANIKARKRMQPSTTMSNWFGHKNGFSDPWGNVSNFWNFVTGSPATGPKATGYNDEGKASNLKSTAFLTGQVLQVRNGSSGKYAHSVYVTGGTNDTLANIKITQHSPFSKIALDELIDHWGGTSCYLRQLKFATANFDK